MKKTGTGIASFIAVVLASCWLLVPCAAAREAEDLAVEQAQYGVVRVVCHVSVEGYGNYALLGTGFAVGTLDEPAQVIITNNHVVEMSPSTVCVTITDLDGSLPAEVLYRDDIHDIAVLRLASPLSERRPLPLLSPTHLTKSQTVYCIGFPALADEFSDGGANLSSTVDDVTITQGSASNPSYTMNGVSYILTDAAISMGNSGGPMVNGYGQVVGINTAGISGNMNLAVSVDYVMTVLDSLDLPYAVGSNEPEATDVPEATAAPEAPAAPETRPGNRAGGTGDRTLLLLIVGGILLLAAASVWLILLRSRGKARRRTVGVPAAGPASGPITEPVKRPVAKPATEPVTRPSAEPVTRPSAEPAKAVTSLKSSFGPAAAPGPGRPGFSPVRAEDASCFQPPSIKWGISREASDPPGRKLSAEGNASGLKKVPHSKAEKPPAEGADDTAGLSNK